MNNKLNEKFNETLNESAFISNAVATYMTYKFAIMLRTPFERWPAYKMGLIDIEGNIIKSAESSAEQTAMNPLMNLIRKVKKIMHKVIPSNAILSTLVALYLVTESTIQNEVELKEQIRTDLEDEEFLVLNKILEQLKEGIV